MAVAWTAKGMSRDRMKVKTYAGRARRWLDKGMFDPPFPSERKRVGGAKDRSPDLRLFQPPSQRRAHRAYASSGFAALPLLAEMPWLSPALAHRTAFEAGALTVAGQWRSFTAFPCILAIAVVKCAAD